MPPTKHQRLRNSRASIYDFKEKDLKKDLDFWFLTCKKCCVQFYNESNLAKHKSLYCYKKDNTKNVLQKRKDKKTIRSTNSDKAATATNTDLWNNPWICNKCGLKFRKSNILEQHQANACQTLNLKQKVVEISKTISPKVIVPLKQIDIEELAEPFVIDSNTLREHQFRQQGDEEDDQLRRKREEEEEESKSKGKTNEIEGTNKIKKKTQKRKEISKAGVIEKDAQCVIMLKNVSPKVIVPLEQIDIEELAVPFVLDCNTLKEHQFRQKGDEEDDQLRRKREEAKSKGKTNGIEENNKSNKKNKKRKETSKAGVIEKNAQGVIILKNVSPKVIVPLERIDIEELAVPFVLDSNPLKEHQLRQKGAEEDDQLMRRKREEKAISKGKTNGIEETNKSYKKTKKKEEAPKVSVIEKNAQGVIMLKNIGIKFCEDCCSYFKTTKSNSHDKCHCKALESNEPKVKTNHKLAQSAVSTPSVVDESPDANKQEVDIVEKSSLNTEIDLINLDLDETQIKNEPIEDDEQELDFFGEVHRELYPEYSQNVPDLKTEIDLEEYSFVIPQPNIQEKIG